MIEHRRGKNHKRRVRELKAEPHSQKLAEAAVGLGTNNGVRPKDELIQKMDDLMT